MSESPHFPKRYPVPTIGTGPVHGEETVILDPAPSSGQGSEPQGPERPGSVRGEKSDKRSDHQAHTEGHQGAPEAPHAASVLDPDGGGRRFEAEESDPGRNHGPERSAVLLPFGHALSVVFREIP